MPCQIAGDPAAGVEPSPYFLLRNRRCWQGILRWTGRSPVRPAAPVETAPADDPPLWRDWDLDSGSHGCLPCGADARDELAVATGAGEDGPPWRDWNLEPCELEAEPRDPGGSGRPEGSSFQAVAGPAPGCQPVPQPGPAGEDTEGRLRCDAPHSHPRLPH